MKKFAHFLKNILPQINNIIPMDDGTLYITYGQGKEYTVMPITDYETALEHQRKIDGLRDHMLGLC